MLTLAIVLTAVLLYIRQSRQAGRASEVRVDQTEDVKGLGYTGQRKIAAGQGGDFFIAYRKKYQGTSEIFVAKAAYTNSQWSVSGTVRPISAVGSKVDQRVPSIAIDSKNNIQIVWYGSDSKEQPNDRQIKYSRSTDGGSSWSAWKNISVVDGYTNKDDYWQEHPYILASVNGDLFVVWEGKDGNNGNQQIKFSRSADGGNTWSQWKNVQATPSNTQSRPTLVQDKTGRLHLFAYSSFGNTHGEQQVVYSWSDSRGEFWSQWKVISDPSVDSRHATAALGADGIIHLAWRAQDQTGLSGILYRALKGGIWSDIQRVSDSRNYQFFPSIGVSADGKVSVAWMESQNASGLPSEDPIAGKVYASTLNSGEFSQPGLQSPIAAGLYPNIPEISANNGLPVIFESKNSSSGYDVILKMIR